VSGAGDLNGDGFSDIVIGASDSDARGDSSGRAYVFFGSGAAGGGAVAEGVLDADGAQDSFGEAVAGARDLNGDGYADVVVSHDGGLSAACSLFFYLGGSGGVFESSRDGLLGGVSNEMCVLTAESLGDLNHDGFTDVVARATTQNVGAKIYLGGTTPSSIASMVFNLPPGSSCRQAVAIGDVNGDGADDIAISAKAPGATGVAQISVYLGKLGAEANVVATTPAAVIGSPTENTTFGLRLRGAADVNGDGFDEIITGNPAESGSAGQVNLYFGNAGASLDISPDGVMNGGISRVFFGESVAMRQAHSTTYARRSRLRSRSVTR
jgi:hypothetical protein